MELRYEPKYFNKCRCGCNRGLGLIEEIERKRKRIDQSHLNSFKSHLKELKKYKHGILYIRKWSTWKGTEFELTICNRSATFSSNFVLPHPKDVGETFLSREWIIRPEEKEQFLSKLDEAYQSLSKYSDSLTHLPDAYDVDGLRAIILEQQKQITDLNNKLSSLTAIVVNHPNLKPK